jgi:CRP/FNR family transcriptional regulator, anaerobic regulatory protein
MFHSEAVDGSSVDGKAVFGSQSAGRGSSVINDKLYGQRAGEILYRKGKVLTEQGVPDDLVYVVTSGWFVIERTNENGETQVLDFALPGDLIGLEVLKDGVPDFTAEALTDASVLAFDRFKFMQTVRSDEETFDFYEEAMQNALTRARTVQTIMGQRSGTAKIAAYLTALTGRLGAKQSGDRVVRLPIPQNAVAAALGVTNVYLSRMSADLRRDGIMEWRQGALHILDVNRLRQCAA